MNNETDALRSDIDVTRRRMDDTIDAIGNRLQGRHVLDEILGFFRRHDADGSRTREKIARSAESAAKSVVDTIKENPMPVLLIGAGAAWMISSATRDKSDDGKTDFTGPEDVHYDPDLYADRPLAYPSPAESGETGESASASGIGEEAAGNFESAKDTLKEKASAATDKVKGKLSEVGEQAREKLSAARDRAAEIGRQVGDRAKEAYTRSRERVSQAADEYPLELGLGCLALGLVIGLALPTPAPVNRIAGPTLDRLRRRTRAAGGELVEKTKRVAQAATSAAKEEAQAQGLTNETDSAGDRPQNSIPAGDESGSASSNPQ